MTGSVCIVNPAAHARNHDWVTWTMAPQPNAPEGTAGMLTCDDTGAQWPCVSGAVLGPGVQLAHTCVGVMEYADRVTGEVYWGDDACDPFVPPWELSRAVERSGIGRTSLVVTLFNGDELTLRFDELPHVIVEAGPARRVTHKIGRINGTQFVVELWTYAYSRADYVPFELLITASDPRVTDLHQAVESIELRSPVFMVLRSGVSRGAGKIYARSDGELAIRLVPPTTFGDGQALAFWGAFLVPGEISRMASVAAESAQPLCAIWNGWRDAWGPEGISMRPRDLSGVDDHVARICAQHATRMLLEGGPWDPLPYGLLPRPGETGDQQGFGRAKCVQALATNRPEFLPVALYSSLLSLACRPINMREIDGTVCRASNHARWITWDERTHFNAGVSPNRLGKPQGWLETSGWWGRDDQHHSPMFEIGTYALTGSWMLRALLDTVSERILSGQTVPSLHGNASTNSMNAARAIGRVNRSASWLRWATGFDGLQERLVKRVTECIAQQWYGRNPGRQLRFLDLIVEDERIPRSTGWRPVFESKAVHGLYLLWRDTGCREALEIAHAVTRTIVDYGIQRRGGFWRAAWGLWCPPDGRPLTAEEYDDPACADWGGGAWEAWSCAGMFSGALVASAMGDSALAARCREIADSWAAWPQKDPAERLRWLEWTAE